MAQIEMVEGADAAQIAQWIAARLKYGLDHIGDDQKLAICLPGGSTPFPIFAELVKHPINWSRIAVWPGDDRIVAEDHPASNTGKIRALFEPVGAYIATLAQAEGQAQAGGQLANPPHFALVWLGMGMDGHIASLFPNSDPAVDDGQKIRRITPDPLPPEAPFDRITLTMPALLDCDALMFTLGGSAEKRALFDAARAQAHDLPIARLISAADMPITCFT